MSALFTPKYITFDCYGTLTHFQMDAVARDIFQDRVSPEKMPAFLESFRGYRLDEVLGAWKPFDEVVKQSVARACKRWNIPYQDADGQRVYDTVPTWGPHPDVTAGLSRIAGHIPLVILSNAADAQIEHNVARLGVPFHKVYTAEQAQAYKPRQQAFEFMLDSLDCGPEDVLHVSSSFRYDLMTAYDMGIKNKVFINRGHEPLNSFYGVHEVRGADGLAQAVGL